jgi:hypothetical protein
VHSWTHLFHPPSSPLRLAPEVLALPEACGTDIHSSSVVHISGVAQSLSSGSVTSTDSSESDEKSTSEDSSSTVPARPFHLASDSTSSLSVSSDDASNSSSVSSSRAAVVRGHNCPLCDTRRLLYQLLSVPSYCYPHDCGLAQCYTPY